MPHQHTNTTEITSPVRSGQNSIHLGSGYLCVHAHPSVFPYTYQTEKQRPKLYMTMKNADIFVWFYTYAHTQAHANKALVVKLYPWDSFNFFENRRYPSLRPLFFSYFVCVCVCVWTLCLSFLTLSNEPVTHQMLLRSSLWRHFTACVLLLLPPSLIFRSLISLSLRLRFSSPLSLSASFHNFADALYGIFL